MIVTRSPRMIHAINRGGILKRENVFHGKQGQRAFAGHRKYITPNKRQMLRYFLSTSLPEPEFNRIMWELHRDSLGQPDLKIGKLGRDVTKFPIPLCMCNSSSTGHSS